MATDNWQTLRAYVMKFGPLSQPQAEQWLDDHCQQWRTGQPVETHGQILMRKEGNNEA